MSKRPYRVLITWHHKRWGPRLHKTTEEGSSIRRAANAALKAFFTDKSRRKERLDAHRELTLQISRLPSATASR